MPINNQEDLNFDNLNELDKTELDRLKVAVEIVSITDKQTLDNRRYDRETWQVFVLPITILLLTIATNVVLYLWTRDDKTTERNENKKEATLTERRRLLADLETKQATDPTSRDSLSCLIAGIPTDIPDTMIIAEVNKHRNRCNLARSKASDQSMLNKTEKAIKTTPEKRAIFTEYNALARRSDSLENLLRSEKDLALRQQAQKDLEQNDKKLTKLATTSPEIKQINSSSIQISKTVDEQVKNIAQADQTVKPQDILNDFGGVKWFKKNYFLVFGDLRVNLIDLNKQQGIQIEVCTMHPNSTNCDKTVLSADDWIEYATPKTIQVGDHTYILTLQSIDHAGRNPFTLAAYITVVQTK